MSSQDTQPSPTVEDYLGVIYTLDRDGEEVIGRKLAEWLEVSAPTVTATLQRMVRDGWVVMDRAKQVHLTDKGREAAVSLVRRHMLTELLLAKVLGIPWSQVHAEADRMEHNMSASTAARVAELVSDPTHCPHGNPFPGHEELSDDLVPLLEAEVGRCYTLARVHEEIERNHELMTFLEEHGLVPGAPVVISEIIPFNETVTVLVGERVAVLGLNVACHLWVSPVL
jgi:DtxR family Mn-dependent transcriptional regulator